MNQLDQDHTVGKLKGIPVFCVNRVYRSFDREILEEAYTFEFDNGYGASIVKFKDRKMSGGHDYELAVLDVNGVLTYSTVITDDVERGTATDMHILLDRIEALGRLGYDGNQTKD